MRDKVQRKHLEGSKNDEREKNASLKYIHNIYSDYIYILRLLYIYIYRLKRRYCNHETKWIALKKFREEKEVI